MYTEQNKASFGEMILQKTPSIMESIVTVPVTFLGTWAGAFR